MQLGEGLVSARGAVGGEESRARTGDAQARRREARKDRRRPFPRISYDEAMEVLQKAGNPAKWGDDFGGDEETILSKNSTSR